MSSALISRLAFRQSRWVLQRRAQSSTTESAKEAVSERAGQAKEGAQQAASKAQQGLSRVTSSAGNVLGSAASTASNAVSRIGGRTGRVIGWVQGLGPPTLYYARVGGELAKIIYRGRNMQPPTVETVQTYLTPLAHAVRNPATLTSGVQNVGVNAQQSFLSRVRNLDTDTLLGIGIVTAETVGFFCIGEMIGRFKVVGYRGGHSEHH